MINYTELSARISREVQSMQLALGEKAAQITYAGAMTVSGLALGFSKGWILAFCILALTPVLLILVTLFGKVLSAGLT